MSQGYIKLYRQLQQHPFWQEHRIFSKAEAWIDLMFMANHKENKFLLGNELVEVERGSFITSELKLMERWKWSKSKVRAFLELLQNDSMIVKKTDHKKTAITIVKYGLYQDSQTKKEPQKDRQQTASRPRKDTNNNDKNDKNDKNLYIYSFDEFYSAYPKKKSRGQAEKTWNKISPDETLFKEIMDGLEKAKRSFDWKKDKGQYIPHPSTWLNAKGWLDEHEQTRGEEGQDIGWGTSKT